MMKAEGFDELAAPVTCAGPDEVAEADVRIVELALLDAAPPFPDAELAVEEEPTAPAFADAELTTEEVEELGVAAGVELMTTGVVLLFAEAWLVTATLREGVGPVEVATLSVAGTGSTVAVLVLEGAATMLCAD